MKLLISLILLLGLFLRIYDINNNPPSLYGDELTIAYDSYSLLKTGHDQTGVFLPLTFSMGAGRPAGYVYGSIPFIALFGPNELGVRMLSVLSGVGIIFLLYLISKQMFSPKVGLLTALIASVTPWAIALSRGGFEANFALFLVLLGIYFFMIGKNKGIFYIFSAISFGLTIHTYPTYKLTLPLFLPILYLYQGDFKNIFNKSKIYILISVVLIILFGFFSILETFTGKSEERFSHINILAQSDLIQSIEQKVNLERNISNLGITLSKYFHNKPVEYTKVLVENYLQNFSLNFLVIHGDGNPRHNMVTMGGIYLAQFMLIFVGIVSFWKTSKKNLLLLLLLILIAPLPTAIVGIPHVLRSSLMLPSLIIISALGLLTIIENRNRLILISFVIIFILQFIFFTQKLFFLSSNEYSRFWSYPAKVASKIALEEKSNFDYIILLDKIDNIEFAYPVYGLVDSSEVINQNRNRSGLEKYNLKKFDNVYIGYILYSEIMDLVNNLEGKVLFIGAPETAKFLENFETVVGLDKTTILSLTKK